MRPRGNGAGGAPAAGRVGSARPTVLLTTEGTFPYMPGGVGTWCESLIRGLPEVDFVVWALSPSPFLAPRRSLPSNVVRLIYLPLWDTDDPGRVRRARRDAHAAPRDGESGARRSPGEAAAVTRRPSSRDLEREFVPLLRAFLAATAGPEFDSFRFAALLVEMRDHFRRWDYRRTWRSRAAWEVFREHMLSRASLSPGDTLDADAERALHEERAARAAVRGDEPTIGEATEALRWLVRALAPLGVEIPSDIDLVHSSAAGLCALPGILAKTERNTPLFLTEHSLYAREHFLAMHRMHSPFHLKRFTADLVGAVARTAYHLADRIAPVSRYNAQWAMAYGAPRSRIGVIHNGVDEHRFAPADLPRSRRPTVVQVSRIDPLKDQVTLLRVADLVRREIPDVLFLHFGEVGDRDYWAQIRRMHRDRMLEDTVRFMGPTDDVPPPRPVALSPVHLPGLLPRLVRGADRHRASSRLGGAGGGRGRGGIQGGSRGGLGRGLGATRRERDGAAGRGGARPGGGARARPGGDRGGRRRTRGGARGGGVGATPLRGGVDRCGLGRGGGTRRGRAAARRAGGGRGTLRAAPRRPRARDNGPAGTGARGDGGRARTGTRAGGREPAGAGARAGRGGGRPARRPVRRRVRPFGPGGRPGPSGPVHARRRREPGERPRGRRGPGPGRRVPAGPPGGGPGSGPRERAAGGRVPGRRRRP